MLELGTSARRQLSYFDPMPSPSSYCPNSFLPLPFSKGHHPRFVIVQGLSSDANAATLYRQLGLQVLLARVLDHWRPWSTLAHGLVRPKHTRIALSKQKWLKTFSAFSDLILSPHCAVTTEPAAVHTSISGSPAKVEAGTP